MMNPGGQRNCISLPVLSRTVREIEHKLSTRPGY
jgi:hypothetical protein